MFDRLRIVSSKPLWVILISVFICLMGIFFFYNSRYVDIREIRHSFGCVHQWTTLTHTYIIKNTFKKKLELSDIKPSCKCTTILVGKTVLDPEEETTLVMKFETRDYTGHREVKTLVKGLVEEKERVVYNLVLDAAIEPVVTFFPKSRYWDMGQYELGGTTNSREFYIYRGANPLIWNTVKCQSISGRFNVELVPDGKDRWKINIEPEFKEGLTGAVFDTLNFTFWDNEQCVYELKKPITTRVCGPIVPTPNSLLVGIVNPNEQKKKVIVFNLQEGLLPDKFQIISLTSSNPKVVSTQVGKIVQDKFVPDDHFCMDDLPKSPKIFKPFSVETTFSPQEKLDDEIYGTIVMNYIFGEKKYVLGVDYLLKVSEN